MLRQQRESTRKLAAQLESMNKSKNDFSYNSSPELKSPPNFQDHLDTRRPSTLEVKPGSRDWLIEFEGQKIPSPTLVKTKPAEMLEQANYRYIVLQKKLSIVLKENDALKDKVKKLEAEVARLKQRSPPRRTANEELLTRQVQELTAALNDRDLHVGQLEAKIQDLESPMMSRIINSPLGYIAEERNLSREELPADISNIEDRIKLLEHKVNRIDSPEGRLSPMRRELEYKPKHNFRLWQEVSDEIQKPMRSSRSPSLESKIQSVTNKVRSTDTTLAALMKQLEIKTYEITDLKVKYEGLLQKFVKHKEKKQQPPTIEVRSQQLSPRNPEQSASASSAATDRRGSLIVTPQTDRRTSLLSTELAKRGLLSASRAKQQRGKLR
eukprot:CAMPEP_0204902452 /NCGR_PEP_ID=MMETSP1397-20131031/3676_1 /ASSEMBLY_ACC=CAM_ASM_000891 /TAXON_ID=49980 /ORGANISM="Climacostomum Climacostomum virens, Strain Stock W-24" /LENGTH=381 /DNA_ID=CAMNT_0052070957 /DNA_START=21 /DNA_END=1166 /DNA_ORIENTATION=-